MIFRSIRLAVFASSSLLLLSACAPLVLLNASLEQDKFAKTFSAPDDRSLIYLYLDDQNPNVSEHAVIDGRIAGMVRPSFYLMSAVTPGRHRVGLGHTEENSILLDTDQGKTYFITAHVRCEEGKSHAQLQIVDDATGRQHVMVSSLANITLFGIPLLDGAIAGACGLPAGNI